MPKRRARATDRYMGDTITRQLGEADLVVLNKTDLVAADELGDLRSWMAREAPRARLIEAVRAEVPFELMFGYGHAPAGSGALSSGAIRITGDAASRYDSASYTPDRPLDVEALARELARPECGLVRAKGILRDLDGALKTLHMAGARFEVRPRPGANAAATGIACIGLRGRFNRTAIEAALARAAVAAR
jgi:G3E family GTPase